MKDNKSIDGLTFRGAKNQDTSVSTAPKTTKPKNKKSPKPAKTEAKSIPVTSEEIISEDSIDIKVNSFDEPEPTSKATEDFLAPVQAFDFDGENLTESKLKPKSVTTKDTEKPKDKPSKKAKKKPGKVRKVITIILLIIVLAAIGLVTWGVLWGNDIIAKITGGQGNVFDLLTFTDETYEPLKTDANGRTNILAFGTSGFDMDGEEYGGVHDGAALTDSIMMISLNQETGDIAMLSLPRDLKASPTCTATGKINEVYWCNNIYGEDEDAGATALMTEVGSILGVDFQYYAHLNWGSLESIVDILGGITVVLDENIEDYYYTGSVYEAGVPYNITGIEAVALSRARHGTIAGDFSRGASQQKILIGIKNKVFEKDLTISDLLSLASTLGDNLRTNFSLSDFKTLAHLTYLFDFDSMRQISLLDYNKDIYLMTTGMINGISYVLPSAGVGNYGAIQSYVAEQLSNDPRDYEQPTILVLNASDIAGIAAEERSSLTAAGFDNIDADNAPEGEYVTGTTIYITTDDKPGSLALLEDHYKQDIKPASELPENISHEYDFIVILNPEITE